MAAAAALWPRGYQLGYGTEWHRAAPSVPAPAPGLGRCLVVLRRGARSRSSIPALWGAAGAAATGALPAAQTAALPAAPDPHLAGSGSSSPAASSCPPVTCSGHFEKTSKTLWIVTAQGTFYPHQPPSAFPTEPRTRLRRAPEALSSRGAELPSEPRVQKPLLIPALRAPAINSIARSLLLVPSNRQRFPISL